ncbi:MAG: glycosyltransferase family 4 protein [Rhodocyclaceae bacterium]|nr:glycosyltransferase family 4 protein [Rhodocyclaceae bacterium]
MTNGRILFLVTEDWYFISHRLPLAIAARDAGFEVTVVTRVSDHGDAIRAAGLRLVPFEWSRRGMNPFRELVVLARLVALYRLERPDIVHQVALKPVLYGSIAACLMHHRLRVVNAIAGMGFVFSSGARLARVLRPIVVRAYRMLLGGRDRLLILQNPDDQKLLIAAGAISPDRIRLIRGSGVDPQRFSPVPEPPGPPLVVLASRMLWDKGIAEFVDAARLLRRANVVARFVLVGDTDRENPAAVPTSQLEAWRKEGVVEWWGRRDDMPDVLVKATLVCLPSYREGLPKVLLEAAACGRALVATDVPGCREIVADKANGLLVPARDFEALAAAIGELLADPVRRKKMGERGRSRVLEEFSEEKVVANTMAVYRELMANRVPGG